MTASIHPARRESQTRPDIDAGDRALADRVVELIAAADADTRSSMGVGRDKVVSTLARLLTPETLMDLRTALERVRGLS